MQNKEYDLLQILKYAPTGIDLYSSIFGVVTFAQVSEGLIELYYKGNIIKYYADGRYHKDVGECTLFPSKDCRDWENFKAPWKHKHFKPYQKVLVATLSIIGGPWYYNADFYSHWDEDSKRHFTVGGLKLEDFEILDYESHKELLGKEAR